MAAVHVNTLLAKIVLTRMWTCIAGRHNALIKISSAQVSVVQTKLREPAIDSDNLLWFCLRHIKLAESTVRSWSFYLSCFFFFHPSSRRFLILWYSSETRRCTLFVGWGAEISSFTLSAANSRLVEICPVWIRVGLMNAAGAWRGHAQFVFLLVFVFFSWSEGGSDLMNLWL